MLTAIHLGPEQRCLNHRCHAESSTAQKSMGDSFGRERESDRVRVGDVLERPELDSEANLEALPESSNEH